MINAESFKQKIQERNDKLAEEISLYIQTVLKSELEKENIQVPFSIELDKRCKENVDIVRSVCNLLGFKTTVDNENKDGIVVTLSFSTVENRKAHEMELAEMMRKVSTIMDREQDSISGLDYYRSLINTRNGI